MPQTVYTLGHSTLPLADFIAILRAFQIELVADVRRFPGSRRSPQYGEEALRQALEAHQLGYAHLEGLGGRRKTRPDSPNTAWKNLAFRGYADYMQTPEFKTSLETLTGMASRQRTTILCAEAVPWRCHRSLIADALLVEGFQVEDIFSEAKSQPHALTPWARVVDGRLLYPGAEAPPKAS